MIFLQLKVKEFNKELLSLWAMGNMKKISEKITFKKHKECQTVVISPTIEKWQLNSLLVWLLAWTFCGIAFLYYMFFEMQSGKQIIVFGVLLVFWIYFEMRVLRAYFWRKSGLEIIRIDADIFSIKDSIFKYGKAKNFEMNKIVPENIESIYVDPKSYGKVMNDSFWQVGLGTIALNYDEKIYYFGTQLENEESDKLTKLLRKIVKEYKSKNVEEIEETTTE